MMYIVPKKANDMMNVGMLECFTVREIVILLYFCFVPVKILIGKNNTITLLYDFPILCFCRSF